MSRDTNEYQINPGEDIAIIGMACRFPGADSLNAFWQNLKNGVESITAFSEQDLDAAGVDKELRNRQNYVKAGGVIEGIELFDANFFDYTPKEASMIDPQQRLFLEQAWMALEDAGYDPERYPAPIGVFAGTGMNTYLYRNLMSQGGLLQEGGGYFAMVASDKDFLSTRVSYKCNLTGPSITVQTACSTSLVAVHMACQSIRSGECDMALAGGVSVRIPQKSGYLYQEGIILSPDGHCRAFDAKAGGTVIGNGAGVVVLKMLTDALADGDRIYAVIRGSAINNDGSLKAGYTAPSIDKQASVIAEALAVTQIEPESISYIEAHGTGTIIGDPIEMKALTKAYGDNSKERYSCAIGSVKTNIGHLDAAAGIAGLIKTALCLKNKQIPPSLNYENPNPEIDFEHSPFFVNTKLTDWNVNGKPRRAGLSSFGIGGTNVHAILEEAPISQGAESKRQWQLMVLSARNKKGLDDQATNLKTHLENNPNLNLADAAYTLQVGRKVFSHRLFFVCRDNQDGINILNETVKTDKIFVKQEEGRERPVAFIFTGATGSRETGGSKLYQTEPGFRESADRCADCLHEIIHMDLRHFMYPDLYPNEAGSITVTPEMKQAALFVNECALAELWIDWGIKPQVLYGLDWLGECLAAYVGGVISLEDALKAVIVGKFAAVDGIKLNAPQIQIVSGINKAWLSENEATDLSYWDRSRDNEASEGLSGLTPDNRFVLLQIGERQKFNSDNDVAKTDQPLYSSFDGSGSSIDASDISRESFLLLKTLGQLWLEGVQIDWKSFHKREIRQRISLPAYPFQRERYWIEPLVPMATKETAASPGDTVNEQTSMTYHQRQDLSTEYVAPRSETERKLVAIWEDMIGTKPIGIEDDFFELGGHSLLATEIIFKVREHFNIDVPLDSLFEKPTIANISAYIETYLLTISQQESASSVDNREEGEL
jgi:acyl transferase domain-containing protein